MGSGTCFAGITEVQIYGIKDYGSRDEMVDEI